jgi:hypothetical protein
MTPTRFPQPVVACVMSTDASHCAWVHHDDPQTIHDRTALAIDDALWTQAAFQMAVLSRAYGMVSADSADGYPLVQQVLRAVVLELRALVDAYPDATP